MAYQIALLERTEHGAFHPLDLERAAAAGGVPAPHRLLEQLLARLRIAAATGGLLGRGDGAANLVIRDGVQGDGVVGEQLLDDAGQAGGRLHAAFDFDGDAVAAGVGGYAVRHMYRVPAGLAASGQAQGVKVGAEHPFGFPVRQCAERRGGPAFQV